MFFINLVVDRSFLLINFEFSRELHEDIKSFAFNLSKEDGLSNDF